VGAILSGENKHLLWAPPGVAHGFYVLSERAEVTYKTTDYYAPEWERTLLWSDPELGIAWPLAENGMPLLSAKDAQGKPLGQAELFD
jgi:dTDP-4-dehydrorhamnose 3,5-epimerase